MEHRLRKKTIQLVNISIFCCINRLKNLEYIICTCIVDKNKTFLSKYWANMRKYLLLSYRAGINRASSVETRWRKTFSPWGQMVHTSCMSCCHFVVTWPSVLLVLSWSEADPLIYIVKHRGKWWGWNSSTVRLLGHVLQYIRFQFSRGPWKPDTPTYCPSCTPRLGGHSAHRSTYEHYDLSIDEVLVIWLVQVCQYWSWLLNN